MLVFFRQNLAMLAVPKTGSTAYAMALRPRADIVFSGQRKHVTAVFFHRKFAPFLKDAFDFTPERLAVIRDPLDHARSWYRYRQRDEVKGKRSTRGMSFDAFLDAAISDSPPPCAGIGSQASFLTLPRRKIVPVHHLFAYDAQDRLKGFLEERFGRMIELKPHNVSPPIEAEASADALARFRAARAEDFALYERVRAAGGHLHQLLEDI